VVVPAVALVIGASVGMVHAAVEIGHHFSISGAVMGTLVLAGLTSIPNAVAAIRLARHQRSAAVVSEAFNSNSMNIVAGLLLPAALLGGVAGSAAGRLSAVWALVMTMAVVAVLLRRRGMRRPEAVLVIASYLAFAVVLIHVG
jgi:cation:H+ antiporter